MEHRPVGGRSTGKKLGGPTGPGKDITEETRAGDVVAGVFVNVSRSGRNCRSQKEEKRNSRRGGTRWNLSFGSAPPGVDPKKVSIQKNKVVCSRENIFL